jgi:type VI protein secretion system component Hcp
MAESHNNSVTGWNATDEAGHKLPTTVRERSTASGPEQVITIQDKAHHRELEMVVTKDAKSKRKITFKPFTITKQLDKASPQ